MIKRCLALTMAPCKGSLGRSGSIQQKYHLINVIFRRRKLTAIAAMTIQTNDTLNIEDAYKDQRFDKQIDLKSGFLTRSVLCKPLAGAQGCAGVLQLVNKMPYGRFDNTDEEMIKIFGSFCSMMVNLKQSFDERAKAVSISARIVIFGAGFFSSICSIIIIT